MFFHPNRPEQVTLRKITFLLKHSCTMEIKKGHHELNQGVNYVQIVSLLSAFNKMPHKLVKGYGVPHQNE